MWICVDREKELRFEIKEDVAVGFYLTVYEDNSNKSIADYLCDTLEEAFADAEERYNLNRAAWQQGGCTESGK